MGNRNRNLPFWNMAAWAGILGGFGLLGCALWTPEYLSPLAVFISPNPDPSFPVREKLIVLLGWSGAIIGLTGLAGFLLRKVLTDLLATLWRDIVKAVHQVPAWATATVSGTGRLHLVVLFMILLAGSLVRINYLDEPIRMDEAQTYFNYAMRSPQQIISHYHSNNHTLHSLLVHMSTRGPGPELWALRLPACLAGMLLLIAIYLYGRAAYDGHTALLMTALAAGSSYLIEFSILSRGYALQTLWLMGGFTAAVYAVRTNRPVAWVSVGLFGVLSFASLVTALYGFCAVCTWILLTSIMRYRGPDRSCRIKNLILVGCLATAGTMLFYLPALVVVGLKEFTGNQYVTPLAWQDFLSRVPKFLGDYWKLGHRDMSLPVQWLCALLALTGLAGMCRDRKSGPPALLIAFLTCLPILLVQRRFPPARVWLFMLPLYYAVIAWALMYLAQRVKYQERFRTGWAVPALALIMGLAGVAQSWSSNTIHLSKQAAPNLDAEAMALFLKNRIQPGDKVLIDSVYVRQYYYFLQQGMSWDYLDADVSKAHRVFLLRLADTNDGMIQPHLHRYREEFGEEKHLKTFKYGGTVALLERRRE